jgi:predicted RNA-binding protein YlqC (UPF0109 family)
MKELLEFLITKITAAKAGTDFTVSEEQEEEKTNLVITAKNEIIGLIIGKEGKTIKNIRKIVAIRAVLENKSINISVLEQ